MSTYPISSVDDFVSVEDGKLTFWTEDGEAITVTSRDPEVIANAARDALSTWRLFKREER